MTRARVGRAGVLLVAASVLSGCAPHRPFYEPIGFWDADLGTWTTTELEASLARDLERGRIRSLIVADDAGDAVVSADRLGELPPELLFAAWSTATRRGRGGEFDLLVRGGDQLVPVTVWSFDDGSVRVARGASAPSPRAAPEPVDAAAWAAALVERYGLAGIEDAGSAWTLTELGDLATALETLDVDERAAVRGLVLGRASRSPRAPDRELAFYDPRTTPPRIDFFDVAFDAFGSGFVGPVDAPQRAPVMTLLHEFGHALADLPLRSAWERWTAADDAWRAAQDPAASAEADQARQEALAELRRLGLSGPVIEEYRRVRGGARGPTSWAWRQVHESFAEAFALQHLDPDALARVMPEVAAWFARRDHVASLRASEAPPGRARRTAQRGGLAVPGGAQ